MASLLISPPPLTVINASVVPLPTQDDLPCDDGMPMETLRHNFQLSLLIDALHSWLAARDNGFAGGNMFLYYSLEQVRHNPFVGPDFFVALNVPKGERKSWVVWQEGKGPDVVVELLSESTARYDKTAKKSIYASQVRTPEYYWYDPFDAKDFAGFILSNGDYRPLPVNAQGRIHSPALNLELGPWSGAYRDVTADWLRWFTPQGELLPTEAEAAQQHAEAAQQRAEAAQLRAERLAERLRQLGIEPDLL
jgi:Uma2 family endonuclease